MCKQLAEKCERRYGLTSKGEDVQGSAKVTIEWFVQEGSTSGWRQYIRDFKRAFEIGARKAFGVRASDVKVYATGGKTMAAEVTLERDEYMADTSLNMEYLAQKMLQEAHGWILDNYNWIEEDIGFFTVYFEYPNRGDTSMIKDIDIEYNPELFGQQRLFSSVRSGLVKIGAERKDLRPHIRPILAQLEAGLKYVLPEAGHFVDEFLDHLNMVEMAIPSGSWKLRKDKVKQILGEMRRDLLTYDTWLTKLESQVKLGDVDLRSTAQVVMKAWNQFEKKWDRFRKLLSRDQWFEAQNLVYWYRKLKATFQEMKEYGSPRVIKRFL